jgi:hypothetical protein
LQHSKAIGDSEGNAKEYDGDEIGQHFSLINRTIRNAYIFPDDIFRLRSSTGDYLGISFVIDATIAAG